MIAMKKNVIVLAGFILGLFLTSCVKDEVAPPPPPPPPTDYELVHYWHFNDLPDENIEAPVVADFSAVGTANMTYPGTGDGYWDVRTHRAADPVSNLNIRMGQPSDAGNVLRVRNPANTRALIIQAPSTGFHSLVVTYAATRSSNGAAQEEFYWSANGGSSWTKVGDAFDIPEVPAYTLKEFDLSAVEALNDNANVQFRVLFVGEGADNTSGNNRIDNFSIDGIPTAK